MAKGNLSPVQTPEFQARIIRPLDGTDEKLASKTFQIRLPVDVQEKLDKMSPKERVAKMRLLISDAVRSDQI